MTTTLTATRDRLRIALEDSSGTDLWADATLDEGLKRTLDDYSQWSPTQTTDTFTATAGDTTAAIPTGLIRVERIIDPNGWVIPEQVGDPLRYVGDLELSWYMFADSFRFTRALIAGDYTIWYYTARTFPAADGTAMPVPDSDIPLLIAGGVVYALEYRMIQEHKRGPLPSRYMQPLREARRIYDREWAERRRVLRVWSVRNAQ